MLPNKFEGVIGDHGEEFPIERIRLADNKKYMGSCAHDNSIHFWDVAHLFEEGGEDDEEEEVAEDNEEVNESTNVSKVATAKPTKDDSSDEEEDAEEHKEEGEEDSDRDSDDSDNEKARKQKRKRGKQIEGRNAKASRLKAASAFFGDL